MRQNKPVTLVLLMFLVLVVSGCASTQQPHDYSAYRSHMPRSVLVMPPTNDSIEVGAPYVYLSTITRPLAEAGYYVFPVAVVDNFMKQNGLPTPVEMNAVPLDKIRSIIGADAVLYIHIEDWGQKYKVISSTTVVKARAKLVDVVTGSTIWEGTAQAAEGSGDGGGGLIGMVVAAAVDQIVDSSTDRVHGLSSVANHGMVLNTRNGLLLGPYNPEAVADTRGR
ncbi:Phosphonate ABC transporter phosphate-binding periplasmic component (TC 3.A.1.9.1) [hydrothermal vent metagenome]|uniref:Phosphonate ABC transporter phosphate-binding periplasmic component (TC 3.A.1.9.1) n=1 Tax=hydrothermal vent metagenome TaxID=652676 RepID=A0A3B0ZHZ3_9ZZZZ